ncbi:CBS domain-containing protein (plasmid) [Rhizobium sp. CB3090]|uniref:CBS domain-containing protein n=1 Tax=Rhizobium sp. CB3090 TaxID=3039156 RepID=UPI0024B18C8A|nr:CBS domain-containing protein [Rhizobium sp. CB3090]WFU13261.1 CBS domain-containing protein [Rhizobium sp. CB3090]
MLAKDIMTRNVISATPAMSVRNAALLMLANGVSGLPVLDDNGAVCGMLTEGDLIRRIGVNWAAKDARERDDKQGLNTYIRTYGWSVEEAMTRNVVSIAPETDLGLVGKLMLEHNVKRIPVIDHGHLVGIVSRCDLLGLVIDAPPEKIAMGDDAIRLAVATRLATELGLSSDKVTVIVKDGQVYVEGTIETSVQRKAIRSLIENIGGIGAFVDQTRLPVHTTSN